MITGILLALTPIVAIGIGVRVYMGRAAEDRADPGERVAIRGLTGPLPGNAFLACPAGYCRIADAATSPVFAMDRDRLAEHWAHLIAGERRIVPVFVEPESHRFVLIQHSAVLRFPDVITVEFVALDPARSSLAVYSRARYGGYDFGVNRRRVVGWLRRLRQLAGPETAD